MRAGLLTERITFLGLVTITTASGQKKKDYEPVYSCRAYKKRMASASDRDGLNAKEQFSGYNIMFQVRYCHLIEDNQRILYRGRQYNIVPPLDYQKDNTYLITVNRVDE